jgi:uncharacterized membrane protein (DUF2068 family)
VRSCIEGAVLHRRCPWSGWHIVGTTVLLLPFEAKELARRLTAARAMLLIANACIVVYLLRHRVAAER